jgi:hypothetical protein
MKEFDLFVKLLVVGSILVLLGIAADTRRSVIALNKKMTVGFDDIRKDFTRYLTTGECGQFVDNKNQIKGGP